MSISPISSLSQISSISEVGKTQRATETQSTSSSLPFAGMLQDAINNVAETQAVAQQDALDLAMGETTDLHQLMINSALETTAIETAVELTTRVVTAYKEIMQMQI